jgi:hypothetical protein
MAHDLVHLQTRRERVEYHRQHDPGALDARLTVADLGVDGDQLERIFDHHGTIIADAAQVASLGSIETPVPVTCVREGCTGLPSATRRLASNERQAGRDSGRSRLAMAAS